MSRLSVIEPAAASGNGRDLLNAVYEKYGTVNNMTKVMVNSPAVLQGYLGLSDALGSGLLDARIREQLALFVAQQNECNYCYAVHASTAKSAGLTPQQIEHSGNGHGDSASENAALHFAQRILETRGDISDIDLITVRKAGFNDGEIAEIIANVALNIFTNYFNKVAQVEIDFPNVTFAKAS
jgi:uncharacterized peroxidase-related enzyme